MGVERNKERVRWFINEVINAHRLDRLADFLGPTMLEEGVAHIAELFEAFPDVNATLDGLIGEGDTVAARVTLTGTHSGPFAGAPATNRVVTWMSFRFWQFADGKVARTWAMQDRLGLLTALGLISSSAERVHWAASGDER